MDYEQKYKEALEKAKSWANKYVGDWRNKVYNLPYDRTGEIAKEFCEIFPELKESEDERIRKKLIQLVNKESGWQQEFPSQGQCLAWLEKQKEQKPLMRDGEIEDKKRDIVAAIRKYYPADYAEYLTSFLKGLSPEDNSEDEYGQEMLGIAYKLMYEHIPENLRTQEFWDSLKFMREYTGKVAIIYAYGKPAKWNEEDDKIQRNFMSLLSCMRGDRIAEETYKKYYPWLRDLPKRFNLEPKQEWSEEDEIKRDAIIVTLGKMRHEVTTMLDVKKLDDLIFWLKSIHPHWKPSKEQMEALDGEIKSCLSCNLHVRAGALESLYNDLKKL